MAFCCTSSSANSADIVSARAGFLVLVGIPWVVVSLGRHADEIVANGKKKAALRFSS